jgi:hypothetical protein
MGGGVGQAQGSAERQREGGRTGLGGKRVGHHHLLAGWNIDPFVRQPAAVPCKYGVCPVRVTRLVGFFFAGAL